jgi:ribosome-binding factor A
MPDDIRMRRIEAFFLQELSRIVSRELKNPVFEKRVISFPSIKVSRDLSIAHVSVSVLGDQSTAGAIVTTLNAAESVIRRGIRENCDLRKVPKFVFHEDFTMEQAAKIDALLDSLVIPPEEPVECPDDSEDPVGPDDEEALDEVAEDELEEEFEDELEEDELEEDKK